MDLNPHQFGEFHAADVSYHGSAADYGSSQSYGLSELRLSPEGMKSKAIGHQGREMQGTTDRPRELSRETMGHQFIPHAGAGTN